MRSNVRFVLLVLAIVLGLLGIAAFIATAEVASQSISSSPTFDENGNMIDPGMSSMGRFAFLAALLPSLGAVSIVLAVICAAGLVLSYVLVDALQRAGRSTQPPPVALDGPASPFGPPEVMGDGR